MIATLAGGARLSQSAPSRLGSTRPLTPTRLLAAVVGSALMLAVRCGHPTQITPDALYDSIEQRFLSGDLAAAEAEPGRFPR